MEGGLGDRIGGRRLAKEAGANVRLSQNGLLCFTAYFVVKVVTISYFS